MPHYKTWDEGDTCLTLSINSPKDLYINRMHIFPNPASDQITILLPESPEATQVLLYDLQGRKLRETSIPLREKQVHLSLAGLASGAYMLIWKSEAGRLLGEERVVVQK